MTLPLFDLPSGPPRWPSQPRYLMSYAYRNDRELAFCLKNGMDLIIDSGAFTTKTLGKEMDHDGYLDWIAGLGKRITFALSYDVIHDWKATRTNYEYALDRVGDKVNVVPTFHFGSPLEELERLCRSTDFICIGGGHGYMTDRRAAAVTLRRYHQIAADHGVKMHGLAMTGHGIFYGHPWWSVDSSSWLGSLRFGGIGLTNTSGRMEQIDTGHKLTQHDKRLIREYGLDPDIMGSPGWSSKAKSGDLVRVHRENLGCAGARAFMQMEASKVGTHPDSPTRVYLSGNMGGIEEGAPGLLRRAWLKGSPYEHTTNNPIKELPHE